MYKVGELNLIYGTNRVTKEEDKLVLKKLNSTMKNGVLYGDADNDGVVTYADSKLIYRYVAEWDIEIDLVASDVNVDGSVDTLDGSRIKQYLIYDGRILGNSDKTE